MRALLIACVASACVTVDGELTPTDPGDTEARQPAQPTSGPGGSDYPHGGVRVTARGQGVYAFYVFEPIDPQPSAAPLAIIIHGYGEVAGYEQMHELVHHTVRTGSVVIYPRWQSGVFSPCLGPYDIEPCMTAVRVALLGALDVLGEPDRVQPQLDRTSYFGFSFGGVITANLANRHARWGLPVPRAIFLDDLHDGGLDGAREPALDSSMAGIPADVKLECHSGEETLREDGNALASCNALFPRLSHIPEANKDLVMLRTDRHGSPILSSHHGVSAAGPGEANAYDWHFVWKVWDALRSCAYDNVDCQYALGDTPEHRTLGQWSDGQEVTPLVIQKAAPLVP